MTSSLCTTKKPADITTMDKYQLELPRQTYSEPKPRLISLICDYGCDVQLVCAVWSLHAVYRAGHYRKLSRKIRTSWMHRGWQQLMVQQCSASCADRSRCLCRRSVQPCSEMSPFCSRFLNKSDSCSLPCGHIKGGACSPAQR